MQQSENKAIKMNFFFSIEYLLWDYWHDEKRMIFYMIYQETNLQTQESKIYLAEIKLL